MNTQLTNLKMGTKESFEAIEEALGIPKDNVEVAIETIERELGIRKEHTLGDILHHHDVVVHHPEETETLSNILDIAKDRLSLPKDVTKFVENIEKNFHRTSDALYRRALQLRLTADALDARASKLDAAVPFLRKEIEDWISFERECAQREQALSLVKPE